MLGTVRVIEDTSDLISTLNHESVSTEILSYKCALKCDYPFV